MQTTLLAIAIAIIVAIVAALAAPLVVDWNHFRATFETHDGAIGFAQYHGRVDMREFPPKAGQIYVAPRFEIGDPRYEWLNFILAVGKGEVDEQLVIRYDWYEVR